MSALAGASVGGGDPRSGGAAAAALTPDGVRRALETVVDPELGLSVVELGLIYGIAIADGAVHITMTLTAPGCPLHELLADWTRQAVLGIPGVASVEVTVTFDPPWTPARIAAR
jgi:metal-sulfur cluster biosynthetic enzyme